MRRSITLLPLLVAVALLVALPGTGSSAPGSSTGGSPTATGTAPPTRFVFVRPVTSRGHPAPGWTVKRERGSVDCSGTSPSAVNPHIASCFPTALALRACWKSSHRTVLCVRDARTHRLTRIHYRGRFPSVHAPAEPAPMDLVLGGRDCLIRFGGAWGAPPSHPQWVGFYSCSHRGSVYGPARSKDGIDRSEKLWSVRVWRQGGDDIVRRHVRTAYYVGTAAA